MRIMGTVYILRKDYGVLYYIRTKEGRATFNHSPVTFCHRYGITKGAIIVISSNNSRMRRNEKVG